MSPPTFAQIARSRAVPFTLLPTIDAALALIGVNADRPLATLDHERKLHMVTRFVRAIPGLGVHASAVLEHELLDAIGVTQAGRHSIPLQSAISLISVRNHLHQIATTVGFSWSDGMLLQSAVADVARHVLEHGGGTLEMMATEDGRVSVSVHSKASLGVISASPNHATPVWLAGALKLAKRFRADASGSGSHLEFSFDIPRAAVA